MNKKVLALIIVCNVILPIHVKELRWKWETLDLMDVSFPAYFRWGCADSAWQTEGRETVDGQFVDNSWTEYERAIDSRGNKIHQSDCVQQGCNRWTRYKEDIALLKKIGMNTYRFSVEWSKIEPQEGIFDERAMQHYIDVVNEIRAQGIMPIITLFHHTYPCWFAKKNGFERTRNIDCFTQYAQYVFKQLHNKITHWIIFNEPVGYALEGYFRGNYPPCKKNLRLAGRVARNQLRAHIAATKAFKAIDPNVQVGVAHIYNPLDVYHSWNPLERAVTKYFNYIVNDLTIDYFRTGKFSWGYLLSDYQPDAPACLDFIGLNYYTHTTIKQTSAFNMKPLPRSDERVIEAIPGRWKVLYPEGLYRGIKKASKLKKPIYITENGCASENAKMREEYIKKHLYVISYALKKGYDVRGYLYWTLIDCFGWKRGYGPKYGIYKVDPVSQERSIRLGYEYLLETVQRFAR